MDQASQQLASVLNAIAGTIDELRKFGYGLYYKTKAHGWNSADRVMITGEGTKRGILFGTNVWLDGTGKRGIIFSITFRWDESHWHVQSCTEEEDGDRDQITRDLWESPKYCAATIEDAIQCLRRAGTQLMASVDDPNVAECIATIVPRK